MSEIAAERRVAAIEHSLQSHESVCAERWLRVVENQERMQDDLRRHRDKTENELESIHKAMADLARATAERAGAHAIIARVGGAFLVLFGGVASWFLTRLFPSSQH